MNSQKAELIEKLQMGIKIAERHEELTKEKKQEYGCGTFLIGVGITVAYWYFFNPSFLSGLLISIPLLFSGAFIVGMLGASDEMGSNKAKKEKEIQYLEKEFDNLFGISLKYMSSTKINFMIRAIKTGEADTFKEALIVAKKDEQHEFLQRKIKEQNDLMEEHIDAAYDAEEAAERAYYEVKKLKR
jgi:hypothetical protein